MSNTETAALAAEAMPMGPVPGWHVFGSSPSPIPSVLDTGHFVLTRSARSALLLALRCAGVGSGDRVLIPNYYCPTMPAPVERNGSKPVFYPIGEDARPDLDWLGANVQRDCKALLAVHFFGLPVSFAALREFCDERRILLIEDCAHAFFGRVDGAPVGSWGHFSIASLPKFFPVLEGGALVSREGREVEKLDLPVLGAGAELKALWNLLELAAHYGRLTGLNAGLELTSRMLSKGPRRFGAAPANALDEENVELVRSEALADALLEPAKLRRTEQWLLQRADRQSIVARRRANYRQLGELVENVRGSRSLFPSLPDGAVPYVFPVWLEDTTRRYVKLRARHLPVLRWNRYWPGAIDSPNDIGRQWGKHLIQILCHQDLGTRDMEILAAALMASSGR